MDIVLERFKTTDASSYDSVTAEFDLFTDRFSAPFVARLILLAELLPGERVLDVATGTGVVAFQAAGKIGLTGRVVGIDLSDGMLAAAQAKATRAGVRDRVEFRKMDAEALQLKDRSFDKVLSLFGLLHFPDPLAALRQMFRVLRPGGKLVIAVGSGASLFSVRGFADGVRYLSGMLLQLQGKRLFAPAFLDALVEKYIPGNGEPEESVLARTHHTRMHLLPLVCKAGFLNLRTYWIRQQSLVKTPQEFWDLQRTFSSIARKRLSMVPSDKVDILRKEFFTRCRNVQSRGGQLIYRSAAFYVAAQRPLWNKDHDSKH
jgi:SAM-dependent methyltransferase